MLVEAEFADKIGSIAKLNNGIITLIFKDGTRKTTHYLDKTSTIVEGGFGCKIITFDNDIKKPITYDICDLFDVE